MFLNSRFDLPPQKSASLHGQTFSLDRANTTSPVQPPKQQQQQQQRLQRQKSNIGFSNYDVRTRSPGSDQDGLYSSAAGSLNSNSNNNSSSVYRERGVLASSISTQSMKEYYQSDYQRTPTQGGGGGGGGQYRHSQTDLSEWDEQQQQQQHHENGHGGGGGGRAGRRSIAPNDRDVPGSYGNYGRVSNGNAGASRDDWEEEKADRPRRVSSAHLDHRRSDSRFNDSTVVPNSVLNHYASMHRRPTHRNANLLSAALCLIKELDLSSLEVAEHAVRCRIDELHAQAE